MLVAGCYHFALICTCVQGAAAGQCGLEYKASCPLETMLVSRGTVAWAGNHPSNGIYQGKIGVKGGVELETDSSK